MTKIKYVMNTPIDARTLIEANVKKLWYNVLLQGIINSMWKKEWEVVGTRFTYEKKKIRQHIGSGKFIDGTRETKIPVYFEVYERWSQDYFDHNWVFSDNKFFNGFLNLCSLCEVNHVKIREKLKQIPKGYYEGSIKVFEHPLEEVAKRYREEQQEKNRAYSGRNFTVSA